MPCLVIWEHFGFRQQDIKQKTVICKHSRKTVLATKGNMTNLFQHLKHIHATEYEYFCLGRDRPALQQVRLHLFFVLNIY